MQRLGPLKDGAYDYLKNAIIEGEFKEGTIYSLNVLAEIMEMSKTPVRDAVRRLEQEGHIDILPSRGFMIHSLNKDEILDLYQTRVAIEGYCCRLIARMQAEGTADEIVSQLQKSVDRQKELVWKGFSAKEFLALDEDFHTILVSAAKNSTFDSLMGNLNGRITRFRYMSIIQAGRPEQTVGEHTAIIDALFQGEEQSYTALKTHIDTPFEANLQKRYTSGECSPRKGNDGDIRPGGSMTTEPLG